ncbi:MAG: hypothetical protein RIE87_11825 [Rhodospirillales bacterium]
MRSLDWIMEDIEALVADITDLRAVYRAEPNIHKESNKTLISACAFLYSAAHLISVRRAIEGLSAADGEQEMSEEITDIQQNLRGMPKPRRQSDWISQVYLGRAKRLFNETVSQVGKTMTECEPSSDLRFFWGTVARDIVSSH